MTEYRNQAGDDHSNHVHTSLEADLAWPDQRADPETKRAKIACTEYPCPWIISKRTVGQQQMLIILGNIGDELAEPSILNFHKSSCVRTMPGQLVLPMKRFI